ncbi:MAG TPA: hypothetical protein VLO11_05760 [Luteolibacter sp.]|nr:hypothetical protein [Luteolibacter sp.]
MTELIEQLRWRPQIGDPSLMGWLTVAAYGLTAVAAFLAARRAGRAPGLAAGSRACWLLVASLMTLLCLNKQLDLQSLFTDIGRVISWKFGWYEQRREVQKWFVIGVLVISALGALGFIVFCRTFWKTHFLLAAGLVFTATFIVVRAISFHHIDVFLKSELVGMRMNWILELGGIALVFLAAFIDWRWPKKPPKPAWKPAE